MNVNVDDGYTPNRYAKFKRPSIPSSKPKTEENQGWAGTSRLGDEDENKWIATKKEAVENKQEFKNKLTLGTQQVQEYRSEPTTMTHGGYPRLGQFIDVFV